MAEVIHREGPPARMPSPTSTTPNADPPQPSMSRAAGAAPVLRAMRPGDPHQALGLAAGLLLQDVAFANLPFGALTRILVGQINRGHCLFAVDGERPVGFVGWALTTQAVADAWLHRNRDFGSAEARAGDVAVINVWKAHSPAVSRFMARVLRQVLRQQRWVYARRSYADGRTRPVMLAMARTPPTTPSQEPPWTSPSPR